MAGTAWQDEEIARQFVEARASMVPFADEHIRLLLQVVEHFAPPPRLILDLGCGDGILSRSLLDTYPDASAVLLDNSEPMLASARAATQRYGERCEVHFADLAQPITGLLAGRRPDLAVSGFAIHHLPHERKRSLYAEIVHLLPAGGLLVNLEHVASGSPLLNELFVNVYLDFTARASGAPREQMAEAFHAAMELEGDILLDVETQLRWLRELGLQHVDCYFKWLEVAMFGGVRPAV